MRIQAEKTSQKDMDIPISDQTGSLGAAMKILKQKQTDAWWDSPQEFPELLKIYPGPEKRELEKRTSPFVDHLCHRLKGQLNPGENADELLAAADYQSRSLITRLAGVLGVAIPQRFSDGFIDSTKGFLEKVKGFDPGLDMENIYQALRNIWIMNSLQVYLDLPMGCSDAMFAYSLIYPYTDNFMDDSCQDEESKMHWNHLLKNRLEGNVNPKPFGIGEKVFPLIGLIETAFPREKFPEVYQSLILIHNAQNKSLVQQKHYDNAYIRDILGISLEKGGTSVLADGFLLKGKLNTKQQELCFGWGTFLQLSDDLQDVAIDQANGHMTIFSQAGKNGRLDSLVNKLLNYVHRVLDIGFTDPGLAELKELSRRNFDILIVQAIGKNPQFFSPAYVRDMESFSPFAFSYLKKLQRKLKKTVKHKKKIIELDAILSGFLAVTSRLHDS